MSISGICKKSKKWTQKNTTQIFRIILFLTFFGHGLVSLGFSPSYSLHYKLVDLVNLFPVSTETFLVYQGLSDIFLSFLILFKKWTKLVYPISIFYLIAVGFSAWFAYYVQFATPTGIIEYLRRFPWIFYALYVYLAISQSKKEYYLLRIGLSFAFLAHGIASLGFAGFNGGHIDVAKALLQQDFAEKVVFYSGFTDVMMGLSLLTGIFSKWTAIIGVLWILVVDYASFTRAFPDGLFRLAFLISAIYVAIDLRCHKKTILTWWNKSKNRQKTAKTGQKKSI